MKEFGRIAGPLMILVGAIFSVVGFVDFFQSISTFGGPSKFWCVFIGLPLVSYGVLVCRAAYLKPISDYVAGETYDAVSTLSSAAASGLKSGNLESGTRRSNPQTVIACHKCNHHNPDDSKYCNNCGTALAKSVKCNRCNELNDPDARFCDNCGDTISAS